MGQNTAMERVKKTSRGASVHARSICEDTIMVRGRLSWQKCISAEYQGFYMFKIKSYSGTFTTNSNVSGHFFPYRTLTSVCRCFCFVRGNKKKSLTQTNSQCVNKQLFHKFYTYHSSIDNESFFTSMSCGRVQYFKQHDHETLTTETACAVVTAFWFYTIQTLIESHWLVHLWSGSLKSQSLNHGHGVWGETTVH